MVVAPGSSSLGKTFSGNAYVVIDTHLDTKNGVATTTTMKLQRIKSSPSNMEPYLRNQVKVVRMTIKIRILNECQKRQKKS